MPQNLEKLVILGSNTEVGKTTFALLWLALFGRETQYWKPVETGASDSLVIANLIPHAKVSPPIVQLDPPLAPQLAAELRGATIPSSAKIIEQLPQANGDLLLVETFGSAFSPLNDREMQIALIKNLGAQCVLIVPQVLGSIGNSLQSLTALHALGIYPRALVLLAEALESSQKEEKSDLARSTQLFALRQIQQHQPDLPVFLLHKPESYTPDAIAAAAHVQREELTKLRFVLDSQEDNLDSQVWLAQDRRSVWHPYTSLLEGSSPLLISRTQDEFLYTLDGAKYIDAISSWWTILHGHRDPRLMRALNLASQKYDHVIFAGVTHPPAIELSKLMLATFPGRENAEEAKVFFSDDGSTAVEVALKLAYQYWCLRGESQRVVFVSFEGAYHGDTFGAMSVGRDPLFFGRFRPFFFEVEQIPVCAERLEAFLQTNHHRVAAAILEPLVQGAAGMVMHSASELARIYAVAKKYGILFIADEVMTGGGRTGTLWASEQASIAPDLLCCGKTLAGGVLPLAATMISAEVVSTFRTSNRHDTFFHGHSFTAHPLACAIAVENWQILSRGLSPDIGRIQNFWAQHAEQLRDLPQVKEVRICGTILAVEINAAAFEISSASLERNTSAYLSSLGPKLRDACWHQGVFMRPLGNVLYAIPPFCTSDDSLRKIVQAMEIAINAAFSPPLVLEAGPRT